MKAVFDTNILIDYLNGVEAARKEITLYEDPAISIITWIEVMNGAASEEEKKVLRGFLRGFSVVPLSADVAEKAVELRREFRMRFPDAVVGASALVQSCLLVSRNVRVFPADHPGVRVPYQLPC